MKSTMISLISVLIFFSCSNTAEFVPDPVDPPFDGTIFLDPDIITSEDPTTFQSITEAGIGSATMFDRRVNDWVTVDAFLFDVIYDDGLTTQVQVNPEFSTVELAMVEAEKYAIIIGRLPTVLRVDVNEVWIHKGEKLFGGGNNSILIHTEQSANYEADGILEETLVHEASHTSLDAKYAGAAGWVEAQEKDPTFISTYARDNPTREDIAESFLLYIAVEHKRDKISDELDNTIQETMPNRLSFFRSLNLNMYPIVQ